MLQKFFYRRVRCHIKINPLISVLQLSDLRCKFPGVLDYYLNMEITSNNKHLKNQSDDAKNVPLFFITDKTIVNSKTIKNTLTTDRNRTYKFLINT